jgi:hypothetical protein
MALRDLQALRIPSEYGQRVPDDVDTLGWKQNASSTMAALGDMVATAGRLDATTLADIVFYLSPFSIPPDLSPWADQLTRHVALGMPFWLSAPRSMIKNAWLDILSIPQISQPDPALVRHVLLYKLKPIFAANPHPYISTTTGRKLPRPAGGPSATHDYYDEQDWKTYPGIWSVLAWVVTNMQVGDASLIHHSWSL